MARRIRDGDTEAAAKALGEKFRPAKGFVDEMITLDQLKHMNIIKVYGICHNFPVGVSIPRRDPTFGLSISTSAVQYDESSPVVTRALVLEYMNAGSCINYVNLGSPRRWSYSTRIRTSNLQCKCLLPATLWTQECPPHGSSDPFLHAYRELFLAICRQ